jgi:NAD(P)-dependent dehydrogenase (short-subunit alcohol dehydrogenase family)
MAGRLQGRRAVVVGGAGGIGSAIVRRFVAEGARVAVVDVADALKAADLPGAGTAVPLAADVSNPAALKDAVDGAAKAIGGLDTVVHSAAAREPVATVEALSFEDWEDAVRVNLTSAFLLAKYAIPHLRAAGGGAIVVIASQLGSVVTAGRPAYHATKGGLIQLTKAIAVENAKDNIRAVTVSPGAVETGRLTFRGRTMEQVREALVPNHPIGRLGRPEDIANAVLFAASDEASFMTGSDMIVDGGYTAV